MSTLLSQLSKASQDKLRHARQPTWTAPMLATLTDEVFSDADWIYERKLDGVRCLVFRAGKGVRLVSRNRKNMNSSYPELVEAVEQQACDRFVGDGEIVAFDGDITSFARLQHRMHVQDPDEARATGVAVHLYLFDLLHVEGYDVTKLPLRHRKAILKNALTFKDPLRYCRHRNEHGEKLFRRACRKGWEGLIAKRADSTYHHSRSRDWLKFKCVNQQELVIGGWTDPQGSRLGFGALLIGYYEGDDLRYAGKVGTGYDDETLESLRCRMGSLGRKTCPFETTPKESNVHWITPRLMAEIVFTEWTGEGKLRHPRYLGLRHDKNAKEVVRERAR